MKEMEMRAAAMRAAAMMMTQKDNMKSAVAVAAAAAAAAAAVAGLTVDGRGAENAHSRKGWMEVVGECCILFDLRCFFSFLFFSFFFTSICSRHSFFIVTNIDMLYSIFHRTPPSPRKS